MTVAWMDERLKRVPGVDCVLDPSLRTCPAHDLAFGLQQRQIAVVERRLVAGQKASKLRLEVSAVVAEDVGDLAVVLCEGGDQVYGEFQSHFFPAFFFALAAMSIAIATAWLCGRPAAISFLMFEATVFWL